MELCWTLELGTSQRVLHRYNNRFRVFKSVTVTTHSLASCAASAPHAAPTFAPSFASIHSCARSASLAASPRSKAKRRNAMMANFLTHTNARPLLNILIQGCCKHQQAHGLGSHRPLSVAPHSIPRPRTTAPVPSPPCFASRPSFAQGRGFSGHNPMTF